jgi:hypothetical protein
MDTGYLDMNADVRAFAQVARGTDCRIAGGLEHYVKGYGGGRTTIEMMRAASSGYFNEGARAIYLFNYDAHGHVPFKAQEIQTLREIGDPQSIAWKKKHYCVSLDMRDRIPEHGGTKQLPVDLVSGTARQFRFTVGDDLIRARQHRRLKAADLRLNMKGYKPSDHAVGVRLNGQVLTEPQVKKSTLVFANVPAKQGENVLAVSVTGPNGEKVPRIRVQGIELIIEYGQDAAH